MKSDDRSFCRDTDRIEADAAAMRAYIQSA
jgi:hypothetical protein